MKCPWENTSKKSGLIPGIFISGLVHSIFDRSKKKFKPHWSLVTLASQVGSPRNRDFELQEKLPKKHRSRHKWCEIAEDVRKLKNYAPLDP